MIDVRRFVGGAVVLEVCGWNNPIVRKIAVEFMRRLPSVEEYCIAYKALASIVFLWLPDMKTQKLMFEMAHEYNWLMHQLMWRMSRSVLTSWGQQRRKAATVYVPGSATDISSFCIRTVDSLPVRDTVETVVCFSQEVTQCEPGYIKEVFAEVSTYPVVPAVNPDLSQLW